MNKPMSIGYRSTIFLSVLFVAAIIISSCKDNSVSGSDTQAMSKQLSSVASSTNSGTQSHVYVSDASVTAYGPVLPASADPNWAASVCYQDNPFPLNADWGPSHQAYVVTQDNGQPHPWDNGTFDAEWINSYNSMDSNLSGGPGRGDNWSKYETTVTGNGDFVIQLLADNCSWVYLADENGNNPQLIGFQGAVSTPGEYGVTLNGTHRLSFVIFDEGGLAGGKFRLETTESYGGDAPDPIEITNHAPVADAGADRTIEATGPTTPVTLSGSGTDPDGDSPLTYAWSNGATGQTPVVNLGLGTHPFTLTVTDPKGASGSDDVTITIEDTTPPELDYTVANTELWPPNHKMRQVVSNISISDIADPNPSLHVSVASNESANGKGDGNTSSDWNIIDNGDGSFDVEVRAERSGRGNGRTYTITISGVDASGNSVEKIVEVTVPHSRKGGKKG